MSDYAKYKVVRYLPTEEDYNVLSVPMDDPYELENHFPPRTASTDVRRRKHDYFEVCGTDENTYVDFVLDYSYGDCDGEYGKVRMLSENELNKWTEIFKKVFPNPNPDNFRVVEYCWYNCCEPPDYFDLTKDPFYDEV
jgi:hypothetical protein